MRSRRSLPRFAATVAAALALPVGSAVAHETTIGVDGGALAGAADVYVRHELSGHSTTEPSESGPAAVANGFRHVSTFRFDFDGDGRVDTGEGSITDVWEHEGYAYLGTFYEPDCSQVGTRIVDIRDPANPRYVGNIRSDQNTRTNDVKVHAISNRWFTGDVLVMTQEPCYLASPGGATLPTQGGVMLWDVTDPRKPKMLSQFGHTGQSESGENFGVHNTYLWDDGGSTYVALVDDNNLDDVHILDITKPHNPVRVARVGWDDWLDGTTDPQGYNGLGTFAATFVHDLWVEQHDGKHIMYLSYWDAGLILLDVSDPANPVFLGDSDYDESAVNGDAIGEEGNSHVAVPAPAEDGRYVLMGDEDFSPYRSQASYTVGSGSAVEVDAAEGAFTKQLSSYDVKPLPELLVSADGELCSQNGIDFTGKIALIRRGTCTFQLKADNAAAQGAIGMVVYNDAARGDALVTMGGTASDIFGFFVGHTDGMAMESALADGSAVSFDVVNVFDGWGYLHVIDTRDGDGDAKFTRLSTFTMPNVFRDPPLPGDYTMHNIVMGPTGTAWADTAFISWYSDGMVALDASKPQNGLKLTGQWIGCYGQGGCTDVTQAAATNFWGVYPTVIGGKVYVLGSDRNNGLVVLEPVAKGGRR